MISGFHARRIRFYFSTGKVSKVYLHTYIPKENTIMWCVDNSIISILSFILRYLYPMRSAPTQTDRTGY